MHADTPHPIAVTRIRDLPPGAAERFLDRHGLRMTRVPAGAEIPASYWGAPEAGVVGETLFLREDTPVHSLLHTACHVLCMDAGRRAQLHTDCGGDDQEEAAVCYLQCLLADTIEGYSRLRVFADMDAWGYSFRLGSARAWFEGDAADAAAELRARGLY